MGKMELLHSSRAQMRSGRAQVALSLRSRRAQTALTLRSYGEKALKWGKIALLARHECIYCSPFERRFEALISRS